MHFASKIAILGGVLAPVCAPGSILSISSGDTLLGNRSSNLIANGSFEADIPFATNGSYWANGTTLTPYMTLTGWQTSGQSGTYAYWGNDGTGRTNSSDLLPDGLAGLYFGGGIMGPVSTTPTFNSNGTVSFSSPPVFSPKPTDAPVTLSQTVSGLNTSQTYLLDFWTSGEDATFATFSHDGIFQLDITGESTKFFAAPSGNSGLGASQRYYVYFQPTTSSVTFTWTNWGHYYDLGSGTELVLDDVILNQRAVPEPTTTAIAAIGTLALIRRRRRSAS